MAVANSTCRFFPAWNKTAHRYPLRPGCGTCKSAYHQLLVCEKDIEKTAFVFGAQKFEWTRVPFGLHGAAFSLAAAMNHVLKGYENFANCFYDDVIIFSQSRAEHLRHLKLVFETFGRYGLLVNLKKCQFMKKQVNFLGHVLNGSGILPQMDKVSEILNFEQPT